MRRYQKVRMNRWFQSRYPSSTSPGQHCHMIVVARLDPDRRGPHCFLAAVSINSGTLTMVTACANALRIFSDPLNSLAIRSELSLAYDFYIRRVRSPAGATERIDGPDFPFITTCLAIGATRTEDEDDYNTWQIPPSRVNSIFGSGYIAAYGLMAVIDVTDPTKLRYGFRDGTPDNYPDESLTDSSTPPKLLSALEFLNGVSYLASSPLWPREWKSATEINRYWKVMDVPTLDFGEPHSSSEKPAAADTPQSLRDQAFKTLVRGTAEIESLDISDFDHVRAIPNFQRDLRQHLIKHSSDQGDRKATAQLIALALEGQGELDLTPFKNLSAESISTILGSNQSREMTSISLCTGTLKCTPQGVLEVLSRFPTIQNLYLSKPAAGNNQSSLKFFTEMLKMPSILPKGRILVADLLLPPLTWCRVRGSVPVASYQIPFDIFPVQYMLVRHQTYEPNQEHFWPNYLPMGDLFLRPERFAAGFIKYILKSVQPGSIGVEASEKLFDFCSAPPTLHPMDQDSYPISQMSAENSSIPLRPKTNRRNNVGDCWPLLRTIEPNSWTVLVSLHHSPMTGRNLESLSTRFHHTTNWARYALVRTKTRIDVTLTPVELPPPEEIEVVSLKEFLAITSPDTDPTLVDMRLGELEVEALFPCQQPLPPGVKRLSVMDHDEAVGILKDFLFNVEMVKKNLWAFMKENHALRWYPDLLHEANGQLYGTMVHGPDDIFVDSVNAQLSLAWAGPDPGDGDDESDE